jgi:hypothetical protein
MPDLLVYQSILPISFWGFVSTLGAAMRTAFWCLSVFLTGVSVLPNIAHGMSGTYLLGLGKNFLDIASFDAKALLL